MIVQLDGNSLSLDTFYKLMVDPRANISINPNAMDKVKKCRASIEEMLAKGQVSYGITTGFGSLKDKAVSADQLSTLQRNLIISHAVGTGPTIPLHRVRGMMVLRINTLIKGYSGVTAELVNQLVEFFNLGIFSKVPEQGTVGASGDLAPLSHLVLGYLGEGELCSPEHPNYAPSKEVLAHFRLKPLNLKAKEGLACNNGTAFMTTHLAEAVYLASQLFDSSIVAAGLTLEALRGTNRAFDYRVHEARPHEGQHHVASMMRYLVGGNGIQIPYTSWHHRSLSAWVHTDSSERIDSKNIQDAYSLRCIPQVHGPVWDTLRFVSKIVETEMNSATDNPLIFENDIVSGGNFHGQYPSMAADFLGIAMTTLGNISERRIERLVNGSLSKLPSFLIKENPGLNSGFMIFQYVAAALAAENRVLSTPSSVTSLPTCENQEDHVSMAGFGVRKLLQIVKNVTHIVAIELLCASQAHSFSSDKTTPVLEEVLVRIRKYVKPLDNDQYLQPQVEQLRQAVEQGEFLVSK